MRTALFSKNIELRFLRKHAKRIRYEKRQGVVILTQLSIK